MHAPLRKLTDRADDTTPAEAWNHWERWTGQEDTKDLCSTKVEVNPIVNVNEQSERLDIDRSGFYGSMNAVSALRLSLLLQRQKIWRISRCKSADMNCIS
jgi:hypothetical protein